MKPASYEPKPYRFLLIHECDLDEAKKDCIVIKS